MTDNSQPDFFSLQVSNARRFHVTPSPSGAEGLAVVSGGCEHCAADYEIHRRGFRYVGLEFVAGGRGTLRLRDRVHALVPGTVFAYGPRVSHDIATDPGRPLVKYFVDVAGRDAAALLRRHGLAPGRAVQTSAPSEVLALLDEIIRNGVRHTPFSGPICTALLRVLVLKIAESAVPAGTAATPAFATYRRCRQHIEEQALQAHSLKQLAQDCHVDMAYLCRLFRRFDHVTPYQYLLKLKMTHAAERLLTPGILVYEVADQLGFSDPFHFSRTFRKSFGVSPRQFVRLRGT